MARLAAARSSGAADEPARGSGRTGRLPLPWSAVAAAIAVPLLLVLAALPGGCTGGVGGRGPGDTRTPR
ncbi:hypothetical protein QJS66_08165 [Kocuria rhizophila]|nr:hypothetical protein QJS66_08165 [Kocuria rhizophila]